MFYLLHRKYRYYLYLQYSVTIVTNIFIFIGYFIKYILKNIL